MNIDKLIFDENNINEIGLSRKNIELILNKVKINSLYKIVNNLKLDNLIEVIKERYFNEYIDIWRNKNCFIDINNTIKLLENNKLLFLISEISNKDLKENVIKLNYYNLKLILRYIKLNKEKFKILINNIFIKNLDNLIPYFDSYDIDIINLEFNFILKFNLISKFSTMTNDQVINENVSRLQIVLMLKTTDENKIKSKILDYDIDFIKLIINDVNSSTFKYLAINLNSNDMLQLIDNIKINYLIILITLVNNRFLEYIIVKLSLFKFFRVIQHLSLDQFVNILHLIDDSKIECLKFITDEQQAFITNMFADIDNNLVDEYIPFFSKHVIYILVNSEYKHIILNKIDLINVNVIKLFINNLNYFDIIKILKKVNKDKILYLSQSFDKYLVNRISNYIDMELSDDLYTEEERNIFIILNDNINLNLSEKSILNMYDLD